MDTIFMNSGNSITVVFKLGGIETFSSIKKFWLKNHT